jgi:hypothetical protein
MFPNNNKRPDEREAIQSFVLWCFVLFVIIGLMCDFTRKRKPDCQPEISMTASIPLHGGHALTYKKPHPPTIPIPDPTRQRVVSISTDDDDDDDY